MKSNMKTHINYSLESTALLLHSRYEQRNIHVHVYAIRPSLYRFSTFSIFANFLNMLHDGHPVYTRDQSQRCANHLHALIHSATAAAATEVATTSADRPIQLIGFSKGCAVLTQLLYDLGQPGETRLTDWFADDLRSIVWLDSGHNGDAELWPVSPDLVRQFGQMYPNCRIHGYGTPFQLRRADRPRSMPEFQRFAAILRDLGDQHRCEFLLEDCSGDLQTHFDVLRVFPLDVD